MLMGRAPVRPALHVSTLLFAAVLHLHLLWTCGAGSRGSASLPAQDQPPDRAGAKKRAAALLAEAARKTTCN